MKLLLIAYYYPPCAGGGVARALHMSIILSKMGVDVTVITAKNHRYDVYDYSLLDEIGKSNVRVIEVGHIWKKRIDSDRLKKDNIKSENEAVGIIHRAKLLLLRILFFVPDSLSDWFFPMAYYMTKINLKNYDIMITTSPPNIAQVIGLLIKVNNRQIKWVSDFRDLWVENSYNTENKFWKL